MNHHTSRRTHASLLFAGGLLFTLSLPVSADTVFGVYAGAGTWQQNFSGDIRSGVSDIDVENDLGIKDDSNNVFYLALEHPLPVMPNLKMNYVDLSINGDSVLSRTIEFNDVVFPAGTALSSDVEIKQGDAIAYYELFDNYISLDIGIGARYMDGKIDLVSAGEYSNAEFTVIVPLLYGKARADLPLTGFWMAAEVMGMGYSNNNLVDATAQLGWESPIGFGAELGYRLLSLDVDDFDDVDKAAMDISGPYFALNYHF
jgi:outer membrane protein